MVRIGGRLIDVILAPAREALLAAWLNAVFMSSLVAPGTGTTAMRGAPDVPAATSRSRPVIAAVA